MSERATTLFESVKESLQAIAPGLKDVVPEARAEFSRMGTQGTMELASALFNGHAFVPYGPGQYTPWPEREPPLPEQPAQEHGRER